MKSRDRARLVRQVQTVHRGVVEIIPAGAVASIVDRLDDGKYLVTVQGRSHKISAAELMPIVPRGTGKRRRRAKKCRAKGCERARGQTSRFCWQHRNMEPAP